MASLPSSIFYFQKSPDRFPHQIGLAAALFKRRHPAGLGLVGVEVLDTIVFRAFAGRLAFEQAEREPIRTLMGVYGLDLARGAAAEGK